MSNPVKLNIVVADAELVATVLKQVERSHVNTDVVVSVQPSLSQPVRKPESDAGTERLKFIRGLL